MPTEKQIITEFLELYREFTCLWDTKQLEYSNKEARDKAYEILLDKYRELEEGASILDVKKKIENMRTTYRREKKKVLQSRLNSDVNEYTPKLWYYDLLTFLNEVILFNKLEPTPKSNGGEVSMKVECGDTKPKKRKMAISAVYLPEQDEHDSIDEDEFYVQQNEDSMISVANQLAEAEAFGTTVGLQLKELDSMQRVFAEKLISEVIFQARLQKLNENSMLVINSERNERPNF